MNAKKYLEANYPIWAKIDDDNLTKKVIIEVAEKYHERKVENNNVLTNVSKCDCLEGRELLKAFLEHLESTIDYFPCEPSELIDDYYKSL